MRLAGLPVTVTDGGDYKVTEPTSGITVTWHKVSPHLWSAVADGRIFGDSPETGFATNRRNMERVVVPGILRSLKADKERLTRIWPHVEARLAAMLGAK